MRRAAPAAALVTLAALMTTAGSGALAAEPSGSEQATSSSRAWTAAPAGATGGPGNRPYLVYTLGPGDTVRDRIRLVNTGTAPLVLRIYPADATDVSTADGGGFAVARADQEPTDLGGWIDVDDQQVALDPGEATLVPVVVRVPDDAEAGDHVGAVVTSVGTDAVTADGRAVLVDSRVAVRSYVRVSGPARSALSATQLLARHDNGQWWNPFDDEVSLSYRLANTGQVRVASSPEVDVVGPLGWAVGSRSGPAHAELSPGSRATVTDVVPLAFAAGRVDVALDVEAADPVTGVRLPPTALHTELTVVPWGPVALLGLGLLLAAGMVVRRLRRHPPTPGCEPVGG